jgi:hypothetical protein
VNIRAGEGAVEIRLDYAEAERLWSAIQVGTELSRAEYYIRTGLSQPNVLEILDVLWARVDECVGEVSVPLAPGLEAEENPRRPRPPRRPTPLAE